MTKYWFWFGAVLLLAAVLRLAGLDKGQWVDENHSLMIATRFSFNDPLEVYRARVGTSSVARADGSPVAVVMTGPAGAQRQSPILDHPPAYFVALKVWTAVFGTREPTLRLFSVLFGIPTVAIVMLWLRPKTAAGSLVAGLYCATAIPMLRFSQEIRHYSLLLFATALAFYFASRLVERPASWVPFAGLTAALSLGVCTHLVGAMLVPAVLLYVVLSRPRLLRTHLVTLLMVAAIPAALFLLEYTLLLSPDVRNRTVGDWWMPSVSLATLARDAAYVAGASSLSWSYSAAAVHGRVPQAAAAILLLVALAVVVAAIARGDWRRGAPELAAGVFYGGCLVAYSIFVVPIFGARTALPAAIPLIGFVGIQLATAAPRRLAILAMLVFTALSANSSAWWLGYKAYRPIEDVKHIAVSMARRWAPGDCVVFYPFYSERTVRYYVPDLPLAASARLAVDASPARLEQLSEWLEQTKPRRAFLVVRDDPSVKRNAATYRAVLELLERQLGRPQVLERVDVMSLTVFGGAAVASPTSRR